MGSSGSSKGTGGGGGGVVDNTVGSIVWVRRRNGSWWPGKILGPDELSASHLMSPRSGTPVKLLGREDASVVVAFSHPRDWYNLEKSRRVKAFRCGEFVDCIERAESSRGMPIKKREKYARREDAIIHALELEKKLLQKRQEDLGVSPDCTSGKLSDAVDKEFVASPENSGYGSRKHGNPEEPLQHKDIFSSPEHESKVKSRYISKTKEEKLQNWEDDNSEVIPRMRGLQDFGLRTAPSRRNASSLAASNGSRKLAVDNNAYALTSGDIGLRSTTDTNDKSLLDKRKKLNEGLTEESLVKRRDKRRPLVQVLESSTKLQVLPSIQPSVGAVTDAILGGDLHGKSRMVFSTAGSNDCFDKGIRAGQTELLPSQFEDTACRPSEDSFSEDTSSGSTESTESDLSESHYLDPDVDEKMNENSDAAVPSDELKAYGRSQVRGECGSLGNDEPDESALSGYVSRGHLDDPVSSSVGVSKWQLKGKRNIRLMKRPLDAIDGKGSNGLHFQEKLGSFRQRTLGRNLGFYGNNDELDSGLDDDVDLIENDFRAQMVRFHKDRYLKSSDSSRGRNMRSHVTDWEDLAWDDQPALKGYWEDHRESLDAVCFGHHLGGRVKSMLFDVDLKVHASYQGEHVPIVSLMSRLNGQAVIGHPITVEVLEDGSTASFLPSNDDIGDIPDQDGHTPIAPAWRTARRTANFRIPRPHLSTLDGDEAIEHPQYLGQDRKPHFRQLTSGSAIQKGCLPKRSLHISQPSTDRKANRKPPKKVSLSSNQKTRTLSSIAVDHKLGSKSNVGGRSYYMDGLIKSEESGPTTVACIPVKLVFSRLHEAVGRPPSRPIHTDLVSVNMERNSS
ncbi:PWWP domain [Dillenia turbinata]|uniref:PWWP domain n=1 Tax=Dillenia turbinata TaxID=194707 RepID=A0AAN8VUX8_9MAGN